MRSISIRSRFSHILGFHLTSGKTKIKNFEFHLYQVEVSFKQISAGLSSAWWMRDVRDVGIASG